LRWNVGLLPSRRIPSSIAVVSSLFSSRRTGGFTLRGSHVEKAHASLFASSVNVIHDKSGHVPWVPLETEGSLNDFTGSEAIPGLNSG